MVFNRFAGGSGATFLPEIASTLRRLFQPLFDNPAPIASALDAIDRADQAALNRIALRATRR